jgi:hypothetical protein
MTDPEFNERVLSVFAEEINEPHGWWYLSFAGNEGFRGACIVEARGVLSAVARCHQLGINPHGEVLGIPISSDQLHRIPSDSRNILLTQERLNIIFDDMTTLGERRTAMEHCAAHLQYQSSCPACITATKGAKTEAVQPADGQRDGGEAVEKKSVVPEPPQ